MISVVSCPVNPDSQVEMAQDAFAKPPHSSRPNVITNTSYDDIASVYLERTRDRTPLQYALEQFAGRLQPGDLVLDIGCGPGADAALLRQRGFKVVGVDLSLGMLQIGRQHFPGAYVQADMQHLPFRPCAAGLWVSASLLHVPRGCVPMTLWAFTRVVRPGGIILISLKQGQGEAWDTRKYGSSAPRWFTYWETAAIDTVIAGAGASIVQAWSQPGIEETWLYRLIETGNG